MNRLHKFLSVFLLLTALMFSSCSKKVLHLSSVDSRSYRMDESHDSEDKDIDAMISPYRKDLAKVMQVKIATCSEEIRKEKPNSPLLNFVADALLTAARDWSKSEVDIAIQNYGGIRVSSLPKGDITVGHIYELMPFENTLVILKLKGKELKRMLDRMADYGGWPISSGSSFKISDSETAENIIINGKSFDSNKVYSVALPDYVANGGDNTGNLVEEERIESGVLIRDLIIEQLKKSGKIEVNHEVRIFTTENEKKK